MPGGDGTGPGSLGSRTGRGLGYCAGFDSPGFTKAPGGFWRGGFGGYSPRGRLWGGRGRGQGWWPRGGIFYGPLPQYISSEISPEQKATILKQEKEYIESEMKILKNRYDELLKQIESSKTTD
ncbi:MAG: DUF5320 domain-containing protein [Promethearchaeota archaeon]